ncbi:MAG: AAA family ATPase [bacterium]
MIKIFGFLTRVFIVLVFYFCGVSSAFSVSGNNGVQALGDMKINVAGLDINASDMVQGFTEVIDEAHKAGYEHDLQIMSAIKKYESELSRIGQERIVLAQAKDNGQVNTAEYEQKNKLYDQDSKRLEDKIARLQKDHDKLVARGDKIGDGVQTILVKGFDVVTDIYKDEKTRKTAIATAAAKAAAGQAEKNKGDFARFQLMIESFSDSSKLTKAALFATLTAVGMTGAYYGAKLALAQLEAYLGKPTLVRESSRTGLSGWLKNLLFPVEQIRKLEDIVVSPDIALAMQYLATDIVEAKNYGLPYQNALFYGPPGTGKTEMAKTLAYLSGMDYAIFSGADFAQFKNGEDVTELRALFDWAGQSKKGLILFIDEADACFKDRAKLSKEEVDLVNSFLSQTGTSSDKFMIILATNYKDTLDSAVLSRIHKQVPFELPAQAERFKILKLKMGKYIENDARTYVKDGVAINASLTIDPAVTDSYLEQIAEKTDGFSGRDLDYSVAEMRLRAYRSGANILTKDIVEYVINEKIKQVKKA